MATAPKRNKTVTPPASKDATRCSSCKHPFADGKWTPCDPECRHYGPLKVGRVVQETLSREQGNAGKLASIRPGQVLASGRDRLSATGDLCGLCLKRG